MRLNEAIQTIELMAGGAVSSAVVAYLAYRATPINWEFVALFTTYLAYHAGRAIFRDFLRGKEGASHAQTADH